jgi:hypothetical protein
MFKLASFALVALTAASVVNGAAVFARKTPPPGWIAPILEPYNDYNTRYLAIGCQNKHNTRFFDDCCHPMKKGETLEKNRKAYCRPGANPASSSIPPAITLVAKPSSSPAPKPTSVPDEGDDCEDDEDDEDDDDDEDCEDEPVSSPAVPSYTTTPAPIPSETPKPTPTPSPSPAKPSPVEPSSEEPKPSPAKSSSEEPKPSPTSSSSETHTGGYATWYTQNGNAGACGDKHSDSDFIAALDYRTYGNTSAKSKYCGQKIRVSWQGKSVDVIVADACPTCQNGASVDLSTAAFKSLADVNVGQLENISWELL